MLLTDKISVSFGGCSVKDNEVALDMTATVVNITGGATVS